MRKLSALKVKNCPVVEADDEEVLSKADLTAKLNELLATGPKPRAKTPPLTPDRSPLPPPVPPKDCAESVASQSDSNHYSSSTSSEKLSDSLSVASGGIYHDLLPPPLPKRPKSKRNSLSSTPPPLPAPCRRGWSLDKKYDYSAYMSRGRFGGGSRVGDEYHGEARREGSLGLSPTGTCFDDEPLYQFYTAKVAQDALYQPISTEDYYEVHYSC